MHGGLLELRSLSDAIAAAAAAAMLGIFAPLFLIPQPIVCGIAGSYAPDITAGDIYREKPDTVLVTVNAARTAGYTSYFVFGPERSILQLPPKAR